MYDVMYMIFICVYKNLCKSLDDFSFKKHNLENVWQISQQNYNIFAIACCMLC